MLPVLGICVAFAALSLLGPSAPSEDPWGWLVWGREVTELRLDTTSAGSWKPLPVLFTAVFAPLGSWAPELWLVTARTGALLALFFAYRLAARFAGPVAGTLAVVALVFVNSSIRYTTSGTSELLVVGLALGAVHFHLDGRPRAALVLAVLASLGRPEAWPFLGGYAAIRWRAGPEDRKLIMGSLLLVPLLWFGGDWLGSGNPTEGGATARSGLGQDPFAVLGRAGALLVPPAWVAAGVTVVVAWRRRDRELLGVILLAVAWFVLVVVMNAVGYAGLRRFMLVPAALVVVVAAVGAGWVVHKPRQRWTQALVLAALVAVSAPFISMRPSFRMQVDMARDRDLQQRELVRAVGQLPRADALRACGRLVINSSSRNALAWHLRVPAREVHAKGRAPAVVFSAPVSAADGNGPPRVRGRRLTKLDLVRSGRWRVQAAVPGRTRRPACARLAARLSR